MILALLCVITAPPAHGQEQISGRTDTLAS
jgi:hypothetical protein